MNLPAAIANIVEPVFTAMPHQDALARLAPTGGAVGTMRGRVQAAIGQLTICRHVALVAGLWLYIDELDRSHVVSQGIDNATGSYWHGIMHRREWASLFAWCARQEG